MIDTFIQSGIISAKNAQDIKAQAVFIDASFVLPNSDIDIFENYKNTHIDGAMFLDIRDISNQETELPNMLPSKEVFEHAVRKLGISNDDLIILYGQQGMIMGPARVWWMFKGFGHHNIVVLDGGLPAWVKAGLEVVSGDPPGVAPSQYSAVEFDRMQVLTLEDMITVSDGDVCPIFDARPTERFTGEVQEPRSDMRSGHIPNSISLPCSSLVDQNGCFKSKDELDALFSNFNTSGRIVTTCGSGITACALALALYHLGHIDVAVYDGSWSEWGREDSGTRVAI